MNHRTYIKCEVCGSIILVRTQIGWLPTHPIRVHCPKCRILIPGVFTQNPEIPQFNITFENAIEVGMQDPDYYIEVSGELLTSKIRPFEKDKDQYPLPPFFNALHAMSDEKNKTGNWAEGFAKFKGDFLSFLHFIQNDWPFIRRLHEIWLSGNHDFLGSQMRDKLPADIFPLNNDLEYLRGIHQLFLMGFHPVLPKDFFEITAKSLRDNVSEIARKNPVGPIALTEFFHDKGLLDYYEERALKILNGFVDKYPYFITAMGLENYKEAPDLSKNGITTVSFDDIKHYYLECFEAIGEIIALVAAYNNLKYRNDPFVMQESNFKTIKTLQDFIDMQNKGNKITFFQEDEVFSNLICLDSDNGLRNAIGHDSYSYDGVNQVIRYYASGKNGKGAQAEIYLLEFIQKALKQFYTMIVLIELLYQTRKLYYVQHGIRPISSQVLEKRKREKIGRNELCPCGSGKKYKKCCGAF